MMKKMTNNNKKKMMMKKKNQNHESKYVSRFVGPSSWSNASLDKPHVINNTHFMSSGSPAESEQTSASSNEDMFGDDPNGLDEVTSTSDNDTDHHNMKPKAPGSGHGRHGSQPSARLPSQGAWSWTSRGQA